MNGPAGSARSNAGSRSRAQAKALIKKLEDPAVVLVEDLKAGYQDCSRLVLLCKRYQQEVYLHKERAAIEALQGALSLRIF